MLIVERDAEAARHVETILNYLEMTPVASPPDADLINHLEARPSPYMILLGDCGGRKVLTEVFKRIKAADPYTPVLFMGDAQTTALPTELQHDVLARLSVPLIQSELESALQKVKTYRENRHQEGSPRSLELFRNLVGSSPGIQRV